MTPPATANAPSAPEPPAAHSAPAPAHKRAPSHSARNGRSRKIVFGVLATLAVGTGVFFGLRHLRYALTHEDTDDAQVQGHISPVLPRVSGYVARVLVNDNQRVAAGQPLVEIDPAELDLRIAGAEAARQNAGAALANARAAAEVAAANVETARVLRDKTADDLARDKKLFAGNAITDRQLADSQAAADQAAAQFAAQTKQAAAAQTQVGVSETLVGQRRAELDLAKLQRSYATVTAPIAGLVSIKNVEPGQFVQAGQTLLAITDDSDVWVVANFKETQLTDLRAGQPVEITADSYPDVVFHGKVDSIAGATGARFALLPPDNATGNFVKVTQRLPVKIVLTDPPDPEHPLRPGMSVEPSVRVKN
ncbi:MAG TPA: HlyD family secretion protein [Opitutaceae bacterium]|nr:HlyD family secretion protein [Opitutaceae bacterium]